MVLVCLLIAVFAAALAVPAPQFYGGYQSYPNYGGYNAYPGSFGGIYPGGYGNYGESIHWKFLLNPKIIRELILFWTNLGFGGGFGGDYYGNILEFFKI